MTEGKKIRRFLIPSLLAAGFIAHDPATAAVPQVTTSGGDDPNRADAPRPFAQDHLVTLAQHASHASHSSGGYSGGHASHASHSSGGYSGGHASHMSHTSHRSSATYEPYDDADYGTSPPPVPAPPPPPPLMPAPNGPRTMPPRGTGGLFDTPSASSEATAPTQNALPAMPGRSQRFASIVRRVQIALLAQGFYDGPINGAVGPATRAALREFQRSRDLEETGTITPPTLDALRVSSD
jgi:His-Xaa-Ser repeat protein HxsA